MHTSGYPEQEYAQYSEDHCAYCGKVLFSTRPTPGDWNYEGYCDAACAGMHAIQFAKFPDDEVHGLTRKQLMRAMSKLSSYVIRRAGPDHCDDAAQTALYHCGSID